MNIKQKKDPYLQSSEVPFFDLRETPTQKWNAEEFVKVY